MQLRAMFSSVPRWIKVLAWLLASTLVLSFLVAVCVVWSFVDRGFCMTVQNRTLSSVQGLEFTVEDSQCGLLGAVGVRTISVARTSDPLSWFGLGRTQVFGALGISDEVPSVMEVDPHTVRISIDRVSQIVLANDQWKDITILYDIVRIDYPGKNDPPNR